MKNFFLDVVVPLVGGFFVLVFFVLFCIAVARTALVLSHWLHLL